MVSEAFAYFSLLLFLPCCSFCSDPTRLRPRSLPDLSRIGIELSHDQENDMAPMAPQKLSYQFWHLGRILKTWLCGRRPERVQKQVPATTYWPLRFELLEDRTML